MDSPGSSMAASASAASSASSAARSASITDSGTMAATPLPADGQVGYDAAAGVLYGVRDGRGVGGEGTRGSLIPFRLRPRRRAARDSHGSGVPHVAGDA